VGPNGASSAAFPGFVLEPVKPQEFNPKTNTIKHGRARFIRVISAEILNLQS
jgi:hypothetical protein